MALDNAQFMSELSIVDPPGTDPLSEGDDQIRTSKRTQQQSFPNVDKAVTTTADQLNDVAIKTAANTFTLVNTFLASLRAADQTASTPSYSFTSDPTTGMYKPGTSLGWAISGVAAAFLLPAQFRMLSDGQAAAPAFGFGNDVGMGMYRGGAGLLNFAVSGAELFSITAAGIIHNAVSSNQSGSAAAPGITFNTVRDMGFMALSTSIMGFATGGVERGRITSSLWEFNQPIQTVNEGTVTRGIDTQARTGWRYTNAANQPMWSIYLGTTPNNVLSFQRYSNAGVFQDIPFQIEQSLGLIRMSTLPTSNAGLIAGQLWRNPVSPGFVAIV